MSRKSLVVKGVGEGGGAVGVQTPLKKFTYSYANPKGSCCCSTHDAIKLQKLSNTVGRLWELLMFCPPE